MSNKSYHHENLKSELIRQGLMLLDREGYNNFSLRKVAKACNVSQTAPYRHFKNKDDLILAIIIEATQAFNKSLEEAVVNYPDDPAKQLKEMGISYISFFSKNPEYLRLIFSSDIFNKIHLSTDGKEKQSVGLENYLKSGHPFATFYKAVINYASTASNSSLDQDELILYCWGLVHGISVLLSNKHAYPLKSDYMEIAKKIIHNDQFLK